MTSQRFNTIVPITALLLTSFFAQAQGIPDGSAKTSSAETLPKNILQWHHLDPQTDSVMGISTERTYRELLAGRKAMPVIVAVIDGGADITHDDLKRVVWTNPKEIAGNKRDDDRNGYVDDVHGWNFLGNPDGRNVHYDNLEVTRLYAQLKPLYEGKDRASLPRRKQREYDLYQPAKADYEAKLKEYTAWYEFASKTLQLSRAAIDRLKAAWQVSQLDSVRLHYPSTTDTSLLKDAAFLYRLVKRFNSRDAEASVAAWEGNTESVKAIIDYGLNPDYNSRDIVNEHPHKIRERGYGNPDVIGPRAGHGTHIAGIIAGDHANKIGIKGIADQATIMVIHSTPEGDERDKDVANAIRYATDNGASIINMSFGKYFSPQQEAVDDAIRYAAAKGVLLIHAAGNDAKNLDSTLSFPSAVFVNGKRATNVIMVGASGQKNDQTLATDFSNYGQAEVDVFAPGVDVYAPWLRNSYQAIGGTSMAAPMVTGIAAVLKSYFPELTPKEIKRIILQSAIPYHTQVLKPGTDELVDFATLSKTGAIANLYEAVKLASTKEKTTDVR